MRMGQADVESLRALFTELEFTTLLKELLPVVEATDGVYKEDATADEVAALLKRLAPGSALAVAIGAGPQPVADEDDAEEEPVEEEAQGELLPLLAAPASKPAPSSEPRIALSAVPGEAVSATLAGTIAGKLAAVLSDPATPKAIHDLKSAMHALPQIDFQGVAHDPMLYSYLIDPTYSSHKLADVALRRFNLKLSGRLVEAADITGRLTETLRKQVEDLDLRKVYDDIDLPLVPVLARMEQAGVQIDTSALASMSIKLEREAALKAREIYDLAGVEFNINSPKQLGDVLFNRLSLPKPVKYGKGRTISTAVDVLEGLAVDHAIAALWCSNTGNCPSSNPLMWTHFRHSLTHRPGRVHTTFGQTGTATGRLSSTNPNLQNIPIRTELGREIRAAFIAEPGHVLLAADYSQIELRLLAHFSSDPLLVEAYRRGDDIHTLTASQVFGVPPLMVTSDHRRQAKVVNFGIVYGLSAFGLSQQLGIEPSRGEEIYSGLFRTIQRSAAIYRSHARRSAPRWLRQDSVWTNSSDPRHQQQERQSARIRRAHRCQHPIAGHRGRSH